jgi:hypothetical protein
MELLHDGVCGSEFVEQSQIPPKQGLSYSIQIDQLLELLNWNHFSLSSPKVV